MGSKDFVPALCFSCCWVCGYGVLGLGCELTLNVRMQCKSILQVMLTQLLYLPVLGSSLPLQPRNYHTPDPHKHHQPTISPPNTGGQLAPPFLQTSSEMSLHTFLGKAGISSLPSEIAMCWCGQWV